MSQDTVHPHRLVVIGGGVAAAKLAESYRQAGGAGAVVVVSDEELPPYNRPMLTRFCLQDGVGPEEISTLRPTSFDDLDVELVLGTRADEIDAVGHTVALDDGSVIHYGSLVVATGASPRMPPVPGMFLDGVSTFRTYRDACDLRDRGAGPVVVAGGGVLGCELAASLRNAGAEVTLIDRRQTLLAGLRSPALSAQIADLFRRSGVDVRPGDHVRRAAGSRGALTAVLTVSGQRIEASRLIFAIGVDPANALLRRAGATIRNGICVDEHMRTTLADVYAVGDVSGLPASGHWLTASAQGSALGCRLAGLEEATDDGREATLAGFHVRLFGVRLHAIGDFASEMDEVEIDGSIDQHRLLATLSRRGVVVAGIALNQPPSVLDRIRGLIRSAAVEAAEAEETGGLTTPAAHVPVFA